MGLAGCSNRDESGENSLGPIAVVTSSLDRVASTAHSFTTTLTIQGEAVLASSIGSAAVVLSDGFKDMAVSRIDRVDDQTITVDISGGFAMESGGLPHSYGTITLAPGAIHDSSGIGTARIMIAHPHIGVISEAMMYVDGSMDIYVGLTGTDFTANLKPEMFSVVGPDKSWPVTAVERTHSSEARLSIAMSAVDLDDAIRQLRDGTVTASGDALTIGTKLEGPTTISGASLHGQITSLKDEGDVRTLSVNLTPRRGYFDGLTPDALVFTRDFAQAQDVQVTPTDAGAVVRFTLPDLTPIEDVVMAGRIGVKDGALRNQWGSVARDAGLVLRWAGGNEPKSVVETALSFWGEYGDTIGTVGSVAGNVAKAAGAAKTVLEMFGVIESTNAKIDKVYSQMNKQFAATQNKLNEMHNDINTLLNDSKEIKERLASVLTQGRLTQEQIAQAERNREVAIAVERWSSYLNDLRALEDMTFSFQDQSLNELADILKNDSVTVQKDTQGTVAVLNRHTGRANTGFNLAPTSQTYDLPSTFVDKVKAAKKVPEKGLDELLQLLQRQYDAKTAREILDSVVLQSVYITASKTTFDDYLPLFLRVARGLPSNITSTNNPLYYHDIAVESTFNWESDTHAVKNQTRLYISTVLAESALNVMGYLGTIQNNSDSQIKKVQQTVTEAARVLTTNTGFRPTPPKHFAYNTHARQPVTILLATLFSSQAGANGPILHCWIDLNPTLETYRPNARLDTSATEQPGMPELFNKPVVTPIQLQLMAHNAQQRGTDFWSETFDQGLNAPDVVAQEVEVDPWSEDPFDIPDAPAQQLQQFRGYPNTVPIFAELSFYQSNNGQTWGFTGQTLNWDSQVETYSRDLWRQDTGLAKPDSGVRFEWAFFSAS